MAHNDLNDLGSMLRTFLEDMRQSTLLVHANSNLVELRLDGDLIGRAVPGTTEAAVLIAASALPDIALAWDDNQREKRRGTDDPDEAPGLDAIKVPTPGDLVAASVVATRAEAAEALRVFVTALRKVDPLSPRAYPVKVVRAMPDRVRVLVMQKLLAWNVHRNGDTYHLSPAMTVPPTHT